MGAVTARRRSGKWEYRFEGASINGKRKQYSKSGFSTKKEALEAGAKAFNEYNYAGIKFDPVDISFSDYLDFWIENYCKSNVSAGTITAYEKKIRTHIKPALGAYRLRSLSAATIQQFIYDKFNAGYSRNTLIVLKGILTGSLNYAVEPLQYIQFNPAKMTKIPSKRVEPQVPTRSKVRSIIPADQIDVIFKRFPEFHSCYLPLLLAYHCGTRLGETFAITWDDVDFEAGSISINKQVQNRDGWIFLPPKYDSKRVILIDSIVIDYLRRLKERQEKALDLYGELYIQLYVSADRKINNNKDGQPVHLINIRDDGSYIQPRVMQHAGRIIHYELGFKEWDFHSMRHTHATLLMENGANPIDVQARLGHANLNMTYHYSHDTKKMQEHTLELLETIMAPTPPTE